MMKRALCPSLLKALPMAALLAIPALPSSGLPLPLPAQRPVGDTSTEKATVSPVFQAVGLFGDLALTNPKKLLSVATFLNPDATFAAVGFVNGLARQPGTGTLFVTGTDFASSYLGTVNFVTGQETTIGKITGEIIVDIAFDDAGTLYALTDNFRGAHLHSLLTLNTTTAAPTVVKALDAHGGTFDNAQFGAIAWNSADSSLYYSDLNGDTPRQHFFLDKVTPGSFTQTPVFTSTLGLRPYAMSFTAGRLWISTDLAFYSADAANLGGGLTSEGFALFPTPDGQFEYFPAGLVPSTLACVPSATAACLADRFKVEVTYDATPNNGSGPANVVLESSQSVKFTFFNPGNIEMILKVLNACVPPFNKWWVFAGGLTDVGVSIKVTDTATGAVKNYSSTKGTLFQTFADTNAFPCP
ncbi:MAG TPA: hypothetical protein VIA62_05135 [Thermoanaerobaculia bacterium]|nr:hypothetical protein [Thermoanaerobaculia bacterium]